MSKTNQPEASRRADNLPKQSGKVRQAKVVKGAAVKAARKQNENDGDKNSLAVIPKTHKK